MKPLRGLLMGLITAAIASHQNDSRQYKVITVSKQPKKKTKLQSVKNHKSKASTKYKGSKPIIAKGKKQFKNQRR